MPEKMYLDLLEDSDVRHWYENLKRGSKVHGDLSLKRLRAFCKWSGLSPKEIVSRAKESIEDFQHLVEDYVSHLEREGKAPAYIGNLLKPVRSWLEYKHAPRLTPVKITNSGVNVTTLEERVPTKEELARIFRFLEPRERATAAMIAFAGLRIKVLGNYDGTEGLVLGDLPELVINGNSIAFGKVPTMAVVRPSLSKAGHRYFTFLSSEGCNYLKEYLESRLSNGEKLTEKSTVISPHRSVKNRFLYATKVADQIRTGIRAAGFEWRPYVLRSYTDTAFDIAESKGLISHPWRQFFMGHKGDIEARYSTNKGRLPPQMVEEMRTTYSRCESLLSTFSAPIDQSSVVKEAKLEALKSIAKNLLNIDLIEAKIAKEKKVQKELTQDEQIELFENEIKKIREQKEDPQKIVKEEELEPHLKEGWQFVSVLPSQKILIRK